MNKTNNNNQLALTQSRTEKMMNAYNLNHNEFMAELKKYSGVISGSFMFMNFFSDESIESGDIDVYIYDPTYDNKRKYHQFECYLLNKFNCYHTACHSYDYKKLDKSNQSNQSTSNYCIIDGIYYARVYKTKHIDINFILINKPCLPYIYTNFDLDCCKIVYDGNSVHVYDMESLIKHKTDVIFHNEYGRTDIGKEIKSCANRLYFIKLYMLFDVHKYLGGTLTTFPTYIYTTKIKTNPNTNTNIKPITQSVEYCALKKIGLYTKIIREISKTVNLDLIFKSVTNLDYTIISKQILDLICMITTLERVEKYRQRGITEFIYKKPLRNTYLINGAINLSTTSFLINCNDKLDVVVSQNKNIDIYLDQEKTNPSFRNYYKSYIIEKCTIFDVLHLIYLTYWNFILETGQKKSILSNLCITGFDIEPVTGNVYPIISDLMNN